MCKLLTLKGDGSKSETRRNTLGGYDDTQLWEMTRQGVLSQGEAPACGGL